MSELESSISLTAVEAEKAGDRLLSENKQQQALEYFQQALKLYSENNNTLETAVIHYKIGNLFDTIHDTENTLSNFMEGLNIVASLQEDKQLVRFHNRIGQFYQSIYQFSNAHEYFGNALKIAEKLNVPDLLRETLYLSGNCLNWMEEHKKAFDLLEKAASLETNDDSIAKKILGSMGILLYKMKDYERSLDYMNRALELNEKSGNDASFRANILKSVGYVYFLKGSNDKALRCLDEALPLLEKLNQPATVSIIHENYAHIYEAVGDYKKALEHLKAHKQFEDIILNENIKFKTRELQKKFDIAESQREKEIYRLKNIDLANANSEILRQKSELEEKNRNITDSIFYAGRLQKAILPPENLLNKYFSEAFVFFQPKDIVSGDFYWFSGKNERFVIAAVDCTGHGVPGALMSMMGTNFLSAVIDKEGITEPAVVLREMNKRTKTSLQNKDAEITANDGMDIALCSIDLKEKVVYYAGAYRPLILIRKGKLTEIKADRHSIGGISEYNTNFTQHDISAQKGDTIYVYTDGYADQFGGALNRKYMGGRLKEFLCEISSKPMSEQKKMLYENHINWRGNNEQVDDLLVIGFRF